MRFFNVIANSANGSLQDVLQEQVTTYGQAKLEAEVNALNGNLVLKDVSKPFKCRGFNLNAGMIYNAQDENPWKLSLGRTINVDQQGVPTVITEDGSEIHFNYDPDKAAYIAIGLEDGALQLKQNGEGWECFNPENGYIDSYDQNNKLTISKTPAGSKINYRYNKNGQLKSVEADSGQQIEIERVDEGDKQKIELYFHDNGKKTLEASYHMDSDNRLLKTTVPLSGEESYDIEYQYAGKSKRLNAVKQTDQSEMHFEIDAETNRLSSIMDGESRKYELDYNDNAVEIKDPAGCKQRYKKNVTGLLDQVVNELGEQTNYVYDNRDRVERIEYPDNSFASTSYSDTGTISETTDRQGARVTYKRERERNTGLLLNKTTYVTRNQVLESRTTFYVHDKNRQLKYQVAPNGQVIAYEHDAYGNINRSKQYLGATFSLDGLGANDMLHLNDLQNWEANHQSEKISITDWESNYRGQIVKEKKYANTDTQGLAIEDKETAEKDYQWNVYGKLEYKKTVLNRTEDGKPADIAEERYEYDGLQRETLQSDALQNVVTNQYRGRQTIKTNMSTALVTISGHDKSGNLTDTLNINDNTVRQSHFSLNQLAQPAIITHPGGQKEYITYDKKGRESFLLDAEGYLSEFIYDSNNKRTKVIKYKEQVSAPEEQAILSGNWQPERGEVARTHRFIFDSMGRVRFDIDEEGYAVEYRHDEAGNLTDKIAYAERISNQDPAKLFGLNVHHEDNQHHRYFFDKSDYLVGEQFACGQVIQYKRDQHGALEEKTLHVSHYDPILNWEQTVFIKCDHNQTSKFEHDKKGNLLKETDAEGYVTKFKRDAAGRKIEQKRGQQEVCYRYDKLNREINQKHNNDLEIETAYHPCGEISRKHARNAKDSSESRCDTYSYNGFGEQTAEQRSTNRPVEEDNLKNDDLSQVLIDQLCNELEDGQQDISLLETVVKTIKQSMDKKDIQSLLNYMSNQVSQIRKGQASHIVLEDQAAIVSTYAELVLKLIRNESWPVGLGGSLLVDFRKEKFFPHIDILPHHVKSIYNKSKKITKDKEKAEDEIQTILDEVYASLQHANQNPSKKRDEKTKDFYKHQMEALDPELKVSNDNQIKINHDKHGLKVSEIDLAGGITYYYYDKLNRQRFSISPEGRVKERRYNDDTTKPSCIKQYYTNMKTEDLAQLKGGYLDQGMMSLIADMAKKGKDVEKQLGYDKRKLLNSSIDGEGFEKTQTHDAFKRIKEKTTQIEKQDGKKEAVYRKDTFQYDKKNRETESIKDVGGIEAVDKHRYQDAKGKVTHENSEGVKDKTFKDKLGRIVEHRVGEQIKTSQGWDEHNRITSTTNANGQLTVTEYDDKKGEVKEHTPAGTTKIKQNVFGEKVKQSVMVSGVEVVTIWVRDNRGRIKELHEGNKKTCFYYNKLNQIEYSIDANNIVTTYEYDADGYVLKEIKDPKGLCVETEYKRDGLGRVKAQKDANGVWSVFTLDRRGLATCVVVDHFGIGKQVLKTFDGLGNKTSMTIGDNKGNPDQYKETYQHDALGKRVSKTVDPDSENQHGLNINHLYQHDKLSRLVKETDPNGNPRWCAYDEFNQKLFDARVHSVKENGDYELAVTETKRTPTGKVSSIRSYAEPIVVSADTGEISVDQFRQLLNETKQDQLTTYIYDDADREKYELKWLWDPATGTSRAHVTEKSYNELSQQVQHRRYEEALLGHEPGGVDKNNIKDLVDFFKDDEKDRVVHHVYNKQKLEQFTIHADGSIFETEYDALGHIIAEYQYEHQISRDQLAILNQSDDQLSTLQGYRGASRDKYQIWDALGRKAFKVSPNGYVKKYEYDKNGKKISVCRFKNPIDDYKSYSELKPNESVDSINQIKRDNAGRPIETIDAEGNKDIYKPDVLNNVISHTDRNGHEWLNEYDSAKRLVKEKSPNTNITVVQKSNSNRLTYQEIKARVTNRTYYDKAGNKTGTSFADNISKLSHDAEHSRVVKTSHNSRGDVTGITLPNATITKDGATTQEDLEIKIIRDSFGQKLIEIAANGGKKFTVYDQVGRKKFTIDEEGYVIEYQHRHAFDQPEAIVHYAKGINSIDKTLLASREKPFTIAEMQKICQTLSSKLDRKFEFTYNQKGQKLTAKKSKGYVVRPSVDKEGKRLVLVRNFERQVNFEYNSFGELIAERYARVDGEQDPGIQRFYDREGNEIATITSQGYLTVRTFGVKNTELTSIQYFEPIPEDARGSLEQILKAIQPNSRNDRRVIKKYDKRHLCIETTIADGHPFFKTFRAEDRSLKSHAENSEVTTKTEYDANGRPVVLTDAYGEKSYLVRNEIGEIIWEIGFPVEVSEGVKQIPVRQFLYNAHHQTVGSVIYAMPGSLKFDDNNRIILDDLVTSSNLDEKILTLMCSRGLPLLTQNTAKGVKIMGYNESRKPTKSTRFVTVPEIDSNNQLQFKTKIREKNWGYNLRGDLTMTRKIDEFDNDETHYDINAFGECVGEGPEPGTYPIKNCYDNSGYKWFTNADRAIPTISFPDENDAEALFFRSATRDFDKYLFENGYDLAKEELADADYDKVFAEFQRWVTYRNRDEQAVRQDTPYYSSLAEPEDYNVTFTVTENPSGSGYMLRFDRPEEVFLKMEFSLRDKGEDNWRKINVEFLKDESGRGFCGIPLGDIPSNPYEYQLDFYPTHVDGNVSPTPCYRAAGDVMLDTGNYNESTQPIWYMENSTTLVIAGSADDIFGVELLDGDKPVKRIAGTRLSDGRLRIDLAGVDSNEYGFRYVLGAKSIAEELTLGQPGEYGVNLYHPKFKFTSKDAVSVVSGTFPEEIVGQLSLRTMEATKGIIDGTGYPGEYFSIKDNKGDERYIYWGKPIAGAFASIRDTAGVERYQNHFVANAPWRFGAKNDIHYNMSYSALPVNSGLPLLTVRTNQFTEAHALIMSNMGKINSYQLVDINESSYIAVGPGSPDENLEQATFSVVSLSSQLCSKTIANIRVGLDNENYFQPEEIAITDFSIDTYSAGGYYGNDPKCVQAYFAYEWQCSAGKHNILHIKHIGVDQDIMSIESLPRSRGNNRLYFQGKTSPRKIHVPGNIMLSIEKDGDRIPLTINSDPHATEQKGSQESIDDLTHYVGTRVQRIQAARYDNMHVLYFKKLPQGTKNVDFEYVYTTSLGKKEWRKAECHITTNGGLSVFTNNIPAGHYECRIRCKNGDAFLKIPDPRAEQGKDGYFHMNINITKKEKQFGQVFSNKHRNKKLNVVKPFRQMRQDRWGNQRSVTDRKGNTIHTDFNLFNQPVSLTTPPVMTTAADGTSNKIPLTSSKLVNKRAHVVAEIDENGNSRNHLVNQKGQHLCSEDADGVQSSHEYDLQSHCTLSESAAFGIIRSRFERKDGLLIETREYPNQSSEVITYNEDGHEIKIMSRIAVDKNNDNDATFIHPDDQNRARTTYHPLSHRAGAKKRTTTIRDYHPRSGTLMREVNQDGREQSWSTEGKEATQADQYVGNIAKHTDLASQTIVYGLNFNKQIISEVGAVNDLVNRARGTADNFGNAPLPRNLRYLFDEAGRKTDIIDDGAQLTTRTRYNEEDYCTEYYFIGHNGRVYQATNTTYDELHRIRQVLDTHLLIEFGYDKKSHRRYAKASVQGDNQEEKEAFRESWYDYSPAGRVRFRDCVLEALNIKPSAGQGMEVSYHDGRVIQQRSITDDGKQRIVTPTYGVGSAVTGVRTHTEGETEDKVELRTPDVGDRLSIRTITSKDKTVEETFELDIDGSILSQRTEIRAKEKGKTSHTTIVRSIKSKTDLMLVENVVTTLHDVVKGVDVIVTDEVTTHYTAADTILPGSVETKRLSAETKGENPDGVKVDIEEHAGKVKQARIVTRNNANGAVTGIGPDAPTEEGTFPDGYRHFEINSENCYLIKESKQGCNYYFYAQKRPGKTTLMAYFGDIPDDFKSMTRAQLAKVYKPKTLNLDINHQAFSDNFPPKYPGKCIADGVKTYRELAEDLNFTGYADAIAWANNADADSVPSAGTVITIPTMITEVPETAFNGSLPAIEMLLGSMYPALAMPHISIKPPKVNWGLLAAEVAVAAAVIYFTGGTLSEPVAEALGSQIAGAALAYGVGGMAGNAAAQGMAIAAHQQHGFNTQSMLVQGVASAVSGGVMKGMSSAGTAGKTAASTADAASKTGAATTSAAHNMTLYDTAMSIATNEAIAATQQAALMATGLQSKPDWKGFATAAFNGAAGTSVKAGFGDGALADSVYAGITLTGDTLIRGEPVNGSALSATLVGSMVGNYSGHKMESYIKSRPKTETKQERRDRLAAERIVTGEEPLPNPALVAARPTRQLAEQKRTRVQRWNNEAGKAPRQGSAAAELLRAAEVASSGEPYSAYNAATTIEKVAMYGVGAGMALAALPEAAAAATISLASSGLETLGYVSMASAGVPLAEGMLATDAALSVGGATLLGGASVAGRAYNNASRFFGRGGVGADSLINTGGRQLDSVRATLKADDDAVKIYEIIRNTSSNSDVNLISKNTGMPVFQIQRIKNHLFFNTHKLSNGVERFVPDIEIADAWARLQRGNFVKQDINLLHHEYFEARFEGIFKTDYITAHNAANDSLRTWAPNEFISTAEMTWRL